MKEYCVALNYPGTENCIVTTNAACSRSEMAKYKAMVCQGLHAFDSTVAQVSKDCKDRMGICLTKVVNFGYLVSEKKYCEALEFLEEKKMRDNCLVEAERPKCTQAEFDRMKMAACKGSYIMISFSTYVAGLLLNRYMTKTM